MPDFPRPPVLLDTHVWIWLMDGALGEIAPDAVQAVQEAGARGAVLVSTISAWEVAMLHAKGRLRLSMDVREWVRRGFAAPGLRLTEFSVAVAVESAELHQVHGDPADRILIATARRTGAALVTRDRQILEHGREGLLAVIDATP
jgi:PIN domain nuclease of toxin-antitoxin system